MYHEVTYSNPNDITPRVHKYETRSKRDLDKFLEQARKYDGSYNIHNIRKVSEASGKRNPRI